MVELTGPARSGLAFAGWLGARAFAVADMRLCDLVRRA